MRRLIFLLPLVAGCAWMTKPYSRDPLVRTRQAVQGDPTRIISDEPCQCPCPPDPPVELPPPPVLNAGL